MNNPQGIGRFFSPALKWALLFAGLTLLFALPPLVRQTTNIVTETYRVGTLRFFQGGNPYEVPLPGGDRFEYSPFFCLLYAPFAFLPKTLQALSWAFVNAFFFWWGLFCWELPKKENPKLIWLALVICSMELNISLLYQQINAALIGVTLLSVRLFSTHRYFLAGVFLTFATNVKMYPGIFALALLWPLKKSYLVGLFTGTMIALLAPALWVGFFDDVTLHTHWIERLTEAASYVRDDLNISSILGRYGYRDLGKGIEFLITLVTGTVLFFWKKKDQTFRWALWLSIGVCGLLLINPRTESPTFVLAAPCYVFLARQIHQNRSGPRWVSVAGWVAVSFLMTVSFTDLWPKAIWNPGSFRYATKTLGTFILWALALMEVRGSRGC